MRQCNRRIGEAFNMCLYREGGRIVGSGRVASIIE